MRETPKPHSIQAARDLLAKYEAARNQREQADYLYVMPHALQGLIEQLEAAQEALRRISNHGAEPGHTAYQNVERLRLIARSGLGSSPASSSQSDVQGAADLGTAETGDRGPSGHPAPSPAKITQAEWEAYKAQKDAAYDAASSPASKPYCTCPEGADARARSPRSNTESERDK